jgi:hypothetical protein
VQTLSSLVRNDRIQQHTEISSKYKKTKGTFMKLIITLCLVFLFSNCTTVGFHDDKLRRSIDFGEEQTLNVCVFYEEGIGKSEVAELERDWAEELELYKIKLKFKKTKQVKRFAFFGTDVLDQLRNYKLDSYCDRLVYMVGRTWGDIGYEILTLGIFFGVGVKLEIHGAVESHTNTRGFVKSKYAALLQFLFTSPSSTLVHEGYHLMGCPHNLWKDECYQIILEAKNKNRNNTRPDKIFSVRSTSDKREYYSSEQVNYFWNSTTEIEGDSK